MLRLSLTFVALALAVALLSSSVADVQAEVDDIELRQESPWDSLQRDAQNLPVSAAACALGLARVDLEIVSAPTRVAKDEPLEVVGRVFSDEGEPVPGMRVDLFLEPLREHSVGAAWGDARADAEGVFERLDHVPPMLEPGRYVLVAQTPGCAGQDAVRAEVLVDVTSEAVLELDGPERVLVGEGFDVSGRLQDVMGAPLTEQQVQVGHGDSWGLVSTDAEGRFSWSFDPVEHASEIMIHGEFAGSEHVDGARNESRVAIVTEYVELAGADDGGLKIERSAWTELSGRLLLQEGVESDDAQLTFDSLKVLLCEACEPTSVIPIQTDDAGRFQARFLVPSDEPVGNHAFSIDGGGLEEVWPFDLRLRAPTFLVLETRGAGTLAQGFEGSLTLVDDHGDPVAGDVLLSGPDGERLLQVAGGEARFESSAPCGRQDARATFNGTRDHLPSEAESSFVACPFHLTKHAPLGLPLWAWLAGTAGILGGLLLARTWWRRNAPTISGGPPLRLALLMPDDWAFDIVGIGETVELEARFESELPPGYTLRLGPAKAPAKLEPSDLVARHRILVAEPGEHELRGEVLDPKGRVVTRRTVIVRGVLYAEEIEKRWRALQRAGVGDAAANLTPRQFEAWISNHAPGLDAETTSRLVGIFEQAEYSQHAVTRREMLGFLLAERRLQGVRRDATA